MQARSLLFDLWGDYIQHVGGEVWASTLGVYVAPFGVSEVALRQAISRMIRQGWLESRKAGGRTCYSLSARGRRRLVEASRRVYDPVDLPWDGQWRMLVYSIPEALRSRRDDLRRELVWTGFAHLVSGTWISPNPLEDAASDLIHRYGIESFTSLFLARHAGPGSPQELVQRCWDLGAIQASYDRFVAHWSPRQGQGAKGMTDSEAFVEQIQLVHDYRKFLFVDPGLPAELLPQPWRGHDARRLFQEYYGLLSSGAKRFMDQHYEPTR